MSRVGDGDYDEEYPNSWALWQHNVRQVMNGKRGQKALAELREALLALPEKRLVANALSTAGKRGTEPASGWYADNQRQLLQEQGEGVCAVGAFAWHQRVKAGEDPREAMAALPLNPDYNGDPGLTVEIGKQAGMSGVLAWVVMSENDDTLADLTPEDRYGAMLRWLDEKLATVPV